MTKKFRCLSCLYIHQGDKAPDVCPKCGATKEQFEQIPENFSKLIDRSSYTNNLLMRSIYHIEELQHLSAKGMDDNLDPGCLYIFRHMNEITKILKAMILAEINTHTQKGKWG
ncbi:MAG: rubredoxin [Proteobacteria bacterium]|nr:rubredoxin [Pseudomonadota bacterium]